MVKISDWMTRGIKLVMISVIAGALASPGFAQSRGGEEEGGRDIEQARKKTLDPQVAQALLESYELMEKEEYSSALEQLNELMDRRGAKMKPYDKATTLQIRGTVHVNLENMDAALVDFSEALKLNALPADQQDRLRFNLAQIYFVNERYEDAIKLFEQWMETAVDISDTAYFMLAASYYNLEQYEKALQPIKSAIDVAAKPEKRYYDLLNVIYSQLGNVNDRVPVLETMVRIWPSELNYWRQLSALYLEQGDRLKAFAALETAYVNGLIEDESDIVLLAQYYSTFDNPHRGARLIASEMEAGRVERSVENLELLSQLWSQAREHEKAIPVLREAARLSDTGDLSFRLGQALLADEQYAEAEQAIEAALEKGGLDEDRRAEAWMLLGNARFSQAEPGDREQRQAADEAFAQAQEFRSTRGQASDWRAYIRAIDQTERRQAALEREQNQELAAAARDRLITACRAQQLAGSDMTEECRQVLEEAAADNSGG